VQTLFFFALDQIHRKNAHSQIEKELLVGSQVVQQSLAQRSELLVRGASVFSRDYAFQKTFFSSDTATIRSAIRSLQHRIDADLMMIIDLDEDYTVLSDTNLQGFEQKPFPHPELLTKAEATGEPFSALIDIKNKLYFVAIVPLLTPEPSAWFCAGFMVDNQMAKGIKMMISSEVTFLNQGRNDLFRIPATTFPGDQSAIFLKLMNEPTIDKSFISRQ
jgi:hypothetical protein